MCDRVDELADVLLETSRAIHANPELAFKEYSAHDLLTGVMAGQGIDVVRSAYGLETAFEGTAGTTGPVVAVLCEYDALPGIGHACGHNIIATAGLGAGPAAAAVAEELGGRIRILGTPAEEGGGDADGKVLELYGAYQERLKTLNAADFGDLLLHCLTIFQNHADVLAQYQRQFRYLLVDEYQDTNVSQYLWLRLLAQEHRNICCVGDDDQSIYSWRGAEVGNILRFESDFPGAQVVRLEKNYRSTPHILAAASGLIAHNDGRLGKTLWTDVNEGEKVRVFGVWDGQAEARSVGEEIEVRILRVDTDERKIGLSRRLDAELPVEGEESSAAAGDPDRPDAPRKELKGGIGGSSAPLFSMDSDAGPAAEESAPGVGEAAESESDAAEEVAEPSAEVADAEEEVAAEETDEAPAAESETAEETAEPAAETAEAEESEQADESDSTDEEEEQE